MPELPEVETVVRALRAPLIGQMIVDVRNGWRGHIVTPTLDEMRFRLSQQKVEAINRRGKYLLFSLSSGETLIVHLKMTGHLSVAAPGEPAGPYDHTVFELAGGQELRFRDPRKFGRVYLVEDPKEILGKLGPEPLDDDFTAARMTALFAGRRRVLKPLLLDQTFIAGIGNIYADEALFGAGIDPRRHSDTLSAAELRALHASIRHVLALGIEREGASISNYVKPDGEKGSMQNAVNVFRRTDYPCYTCSTPIRRIVLGGRSTHFCPTCQK